MTRKAINKKTKIHAVKDYLTGLSTTNILTKYDIHPSTLYVWVKKYYKTARRGITMAPKFIERYGTKPSKKKYVTETIADNVVSYEVNAEPTFTEPTEEELNYIRSITSEDDLTQEASETVDTMTVELDKSEYSGDPDDIRVTGSFEFVSGRIYSTELYIDSDKRRIKLTKEMVEFFNELKDKFLE